MIGRWAPPALADESTQVLRAAGATLVATTLAETRMYLEGLVDTAESSGAPPLRDARSDYVVGATGVSV